MASRTVYRISLGIGTTGSLTGLVLHFLHNPLYDSLRDWLFVIIGFVFTTTALILDLTGNSKKREAAQQTEKKE